MQGLFRVPGEIYTQLLERPQLPQADFSNKTIIVTGANVGLGKEAIKHFVRLGAARVIGTTRSIAKGEAALEEINTETRRAGVAEFWQLDYAKYDSVKEFCFRVGGLDRVDAVILNAGLAPGSFELFGLDESAITVNVVSTTLLALLLLPILRRFARRWAIVPTIAITNSSVHIHTSFPEQHASSPFAALNDPATRTMAERYEVSKLLQLIAALKLADSVSNSQPFVVVNFFNPGLCRTELSRSTSGPTKMIMDTLQSLFAWTAEEGSRTLVHAAVAGPASHGCFLSECKIKNEVMAPWLFTEHGIQVRQKIWAELSSRLEEICPGVTGNTESHPE